MSYIGPLTQNFINVCAEELKKKETRKKISQYIIDPIFSELTNRFYSYAYLFFVFQIFIVSLLIYIIIFLRSKLE